MSSGDEGGDENVGRKNSSNKATTIKHKKKPASIKKQDSKMA
jgi:hypothetical protein